MLKKIFALMLIAYSANAAEGSLLVQFRGFKGKNCEYRKDLAALFVDHSWVKQGKETLDTAWKKLSADALKDGQPIRLSLKELPENSEKNKIYFRFYALHDLHSADHYESALKLTKSFAESLPRGQSVTKEIEMKPTFEAQKKRQCTLVLDFTKIEATRQEPNNNPSPEGESDPAL